MQTTSGAARTSQLVSCSSRVRMEFTFQDAMRMGPLTDNGWTAGRKAWIRRRALRSSGTGERRSQGRPEHVEEAVRIVDVEPVTGAREDVDREPGRARGERLEAGARRRRDRRRPAAEDDMDAP